MYFSAQLFKLKRTMKFIIGKKHKTTIFALTLFILIINSILIYSGAWWGCFPIKRFLAHSSIFILLLTNLPLWSSSFRSFKIFI